MKTRDDVLLIDRINSTSENEMIFNLRLVFPGNSAVSLSNNRIGIKLKKGGKKANYDIAQSLKESVSKARPDSVLVSGGIDSSVLAALAVKEFNDVKLISAGTEGCEDLDYAGVLGSELNTPLSSVIITEENAYHAIRSLKALDLDVYSIIMGIPEFLSMERAKEMKCSRVISGIGSDELFFGFQRHKTMEKEALGKFREWRLFYMPALDLWRLNSMALKLGLSIAFPYLDDKVIDTVLSMDIEDIAQNYDKVPVRSIGKSLGLSGKITERKKKAMQYGSGAVKLLRILSRKKGYKNVGEFVKGI